MLLYGLGGGVVGLELGWWGVWVDEEMGLFRFVIIELGASCFIQRRGEDVKVERGADVNDG